MNLFFGTYCYFNACFVINIEPLTFLNVAIDPKVESFDMLTDCGAVGMECLYSGYTRSDTDYLESIARRFGLCVTGGSDFHGARKPNIDMGTGTGDLRVPYELLEILKAR